MAASEVQIANLALQILGEDRITALTDDFKRAEAMNLAFASVRDSELNKRRWRFSILRMSLPALVSTPDSDYGYEYQLPGDFIRLVEGGDIRSTADLTDYRNGAKLDYSIEGRKILTDLGAPLAIRYIARITDTTQFTPAFDMAFAAALAEQTCERITGSMEKTKLAIVQYRKAIRDAALAQALELPPAPQADDTWIMARTQ
jgi:hypothetical protein